VTDIIQSMLVSLQYAHCTVSLLQPSRLLAAQKQNFIRYRYIMLVITFLLLCY